MIGPLGLNGLSGTPGEPGRPVSFYILFLNSFRGSDSDNVMLDFSSYNSHKIQ